MAQSTTPLTADTGVPRGLLTGFVHALDHRRLFVVFPFGLIAGVILYAVAGAEPLLPVALGLVACLLVLAWLFRGRLTLVRVLLLCASVVGGIALMGLHGLAGGTPMLVGSAYGTFEARVDAVLSEGEGELRLILTDTVSLEESELLPVRRARLLISSDFDAGAGDLIRFRGRFAEVPGPVLPGSFDSGFHAYFDGIGAYGTAFGVPEIVTPAPADNFERVMEDLRRFISERIELHLSQPAAGIVRALTIGDQATVDEEVREIMASAGIVHVLSVSGLHLTLVAGGVFALVRMLLALSGTLSSYFPIKALAAAAGIGAALFYYALASGYAGNVAALRATVMIVLIFGAIIAGRRALTMRNVAIAAIVIILLDPASVLRASFQLSFAAVAALVGLYELLRSDSERPQGIVAIGWKYAAGVVLTSLVAGAATALFSAYHFQQLSPLGAIGNLITLPLVSFIMMPAALFAVLAMPLGLEGPFLRAMGWSIDVMLDLAAIVAGWSGPLDNSPVLLPVTLLIGFAAILWFSFLVNWWRLLGPALAVPAVMLFGVDKSPDILIADTTQALAIRQAGQLGLIAGRANTFAVDVWSERYGEITTAEKTCDEMACVANADGFSVALVEAPDAFSEDCGAADIVITRIAAPNYCRAQTVVVDAADLRSGGVHWLRWVPDTETFEIRPAITDRGRPWRPVVD